jgi:hypothetical protein
MNIQIKTKTLYHDRLGRVVAGDTVEVHDTQGVEWIRRGWAMPYETKVVEMQPEPGPAIEKRRGRPSKADEG